MNLLVSLKTKFKNLRRAFNSASKYVVITAGRRTGKTHEAVDWLIKELLTTEAISALWVDTKQGNIDKYVERYFKPRLKAIWHLCHYRYDKKILKLPNGKYIDFISAEIPENAEGFEYDRVVINEAGIVLKNASLWYNTILPMTKGNKNKTRFIGTPKGKNTFHTLYHQYEHYNFTAYESPYWDKQELEEIKRVMPSQPFEQEMLAQFLDDAGTVFRNIKNCIAGEYLTKGTAGHIYVMAVDLARYQDFTVITIADLNTKQVVYKERFNNLDWNFQKQRIADAWSKFFKPRVIIDATGVGDAIYSDLKRAGMNIEPFQFTSQSKREIILNLATALENEDIHFPEDAETIQELEVMEYDVSKSGNVSYNAPDGFHDDIVISLALLNHLLRTHVSVSLSFV